MHRYWHEAITMALDEAGVSCTSAQIEIIGNSISAAQAQHESRADDPRDQTIDDLRDRLAKASLENENRILAARRKGDDIAWSLRAQIIDMQAAMAAQRRYY